MGTKPFYCKCHAMLLYTRFTDVPLVLHILITDPEHHRRGAGAKLISWGTLQADAAHLPCFLESSIMGRPLYARCGFTPRYEQRFDLTKYGGDGEDINTVMIRDPMRA